MFPPRSSILVALLAWCSLVETGRDPTPPRPGPDASFVRIAGRFYCGDGYGRNLRMELLPEGRFSFQWRGCLGLYGRNTGAARFESGRLVLKPEQPNDPDRSGGTEVDFVPIRWGGRLYLIATRAMPAFCNAVIEGHEPRASARGDFYLRDGDWSKKVDGSPVVPDRWKPLLLKATPQGR